MYNEKSLPPPKIPALKLVPTGETIVIEGKVYRILKYVREAVYK